MALVRFLLTSRQRRGEQGGLFIVQNINDDLCQRWGSFARQEEIDLGTNMTKHHGYII